MVNCNQSFLTFQPKESGAGRTAGTGTAGVGTETAGAETAGEGTGTGGARVARNSAISWGRDLGFEVESILTL